MLACAPDRSTRSGFNSIRGPYALLILSIAYCNLNTEKHHGLSKVTRRRTPLDGKWFRTEASLRWIIRAAAWYDDELVLPKFVEGPLVPSWVRVTKYKAIESKQHPDGKSTGQ